MIRPIRFVSSFRLPAAAALLLVAAALVVLVGCGYSLVGKGSNLPEDISRVYVEPLENSTPRSQVDQILTQAIISEMVTRRRFEVINSEADADAILRGKVSAFDVRAVGFDSQGIANNYEISITTEMRFERPQAPGETEPEVIWKNSRYVFRSDYPLDDVDAQAFFERENLAIEETAETFARTLVTDIFEGF